MSGDAYFSHAVRGVHDHAVGCSVPVRAPDRRSELLGVLPPANCIDKFTVKCTWMQETFSELPQGADYETVRRYARTYIMMLLSTQLFVDKYGTRLHIRWLPYVTRLEDMGWYSWGFAALSWLYRGMCCVANRNVVKWSGYQPTLNDKGPRVAHWRLRIDLLQSRDVSIYGFNLFITNVVFALFTVYERLFVWMPYSLPHVIQVVHPEILEP
ncbi:hypothetical protein Ahy_B01g057138 [Arachis hypogaea]|uniref:Aminotransferase-like plant mobile domain-containing protein n=1 Tax=Arachis hypogaea TaxID=3818 RepID=A0A445B0C9_ARAHY|nr:hypothetical protein Ahy_B01g057138 [Arachis hypogaea]